LACSISATAPLTAGAAIEVPLSCIRRPLRSGVKPVISSHGYDETILFAGVPPLASAPTILLPGATRSGFSRLSTWRTPPASTHALRVGPRELKKFTVSSPRAVVSCPFADPTVITDGSLPGELIAPYCLAPAVLRP
jgi:hypothetical protein